MLVHLALLLNLAVFCHAKSLSYRGKRSSTHGVDPQYQSDYYYPQLDGQPIYIPSIGHTANEMNELLEDYFRKNSAHAWAPATPPPYKYNSEGTYYENPVTSNSMVKNILGDKDGHYGDYHILPKEPMKYALNPSSKYDEYKAIENKNYMYEDAIPDEYALKVADNLQEIKPALDEYEQPLVKEKVKIKKDVPNDYNTEVVDEHETHVIREKFGKRKLDGKDDVKKTKPVLNDYEQSLVKEKGFPEKDYNLGDEYEPPVVHQRINIKKQKDKSELESEYPDYEQPVVHERINIKKQKHKSELESEYPDYEQPVVHERINIKKQKHKSELESEYPDYEQPVVHERINIKKQKHKSELESEYPDYEQPVVHERINIKKQKDKSESEYSDYEQPIVHERVNIKDDTVNIVKKKSDLETIIESKQPLHETSKDKIDIKQDIKGVKVPTKKYTHSKKPKGKRRKQSQSSKQYETDYDYSETAVEKQAPIKIKEVIKTIPKDFTVNKNIKPESGDYESESKPKEKEVIKTKPKEAVVKEKVIKTKEKEIIKVKPKEKVVIKSESSEYEHETNLKEKEVIKTKPKVPPVKEKEVIKTKPKVPPVKEKEVTKTKPKVPPVKEKEVIKTKPKAPPVKEKEVIKTKPKAPPVKEKEVIKTKPKAPPVKETEVIKTKPKAPPVKETEVIKTKPKAPPVKETEVIKTKPKAPPVKEKDVIKIKPGKEVVKTKPDKEVVKIKPAKPPVKTKDKDAIKSDETVDYNMNEKGVTGDIEVSKQTFLDKNIDPNGSINVEKEQSESESIKPSVGGNEMNVPRFLPDDAITRLSSLNANIWSLIFNPNAERNKLKKCLTRTNETGFCTYVQHCEVPDIAASLEQLLNNACVIDDVFIGVCCSEFPVETVQVQWEDKMPSNSDKETEAAKRFGQTQPEAEFGQNTDDCGIRSGEALKEQSWPWKAPLVSMSNGKIFCGGVLISEDYVLTAAHCTTKIPRNQILVRLGQFDDSTGEDVAVIEIKRHAQYNPRTMHNDVALLKLARRIVPDEHANMICLPDDDDDEDKHDGEKAILLGWRGMFGKDSKTEFLKVMEKQECIGSLRMNVPKTMLCTEARNENERTCNADSGAPLVIEDDGKYEVIGILSWNRNDCDQRFPSTFSRISSYVRWIRKHAV